MRIDQALPTAIGNLKIGTELIGQLLVAAAILSSMIVFSEPAVADVLMLGVIVGLPIVSAIRIGTFTSINFVLWLVVVGMGIGAAGISPAVDDAVKHQLITLFLLLGSVVVAGFVAIDPVRRFNLIMWCYVIACLIAVVAGVVGYFGLVPGLQELFTIFGRARGTFKDPNVFGAAIVPALVFIAWYLLREPWPRARFAILIALPLVIGLVLSFSRGAWLSAFVGVGLLFVVAGVRARRRQDFGRYLVVFAAGLFALAISVVVLLQVEQVRELLFERFSLQQSYDEGPDGRFGGQIKAFWLMVEHPFGIGTNTFSELYHHEEPHNVYLSTFLNAGWIGGLFYLASVVMTLIVGLRCSLRNGWLQGPLVVTTAAFAALVFEGAVIDTDHWRHFFLMMGCVWGLLDAQPPTGPDRRREDLA